MLLAGPGSLLGTFLFAACAKYMMPYNWSWDVCYVLGAILCATDPVAVVALLKQVCRIFVKISFFSNFDALFIGQLFSKVYNDNYTGGAIKRWFCSCFV
jgi:hypothetical protein